MINSNKYADVFQTAERVSNYVTQEGQNKIFLIFEKYTVLYELTKQ